MICDEQLLFSEAFAEALRNAGLDAVATSAPTEALSIVGQTSPPLFVICVQPHISSALRALRWVSHRSPATRLVCLGTEDPPLVRSCIDAGADLVLSKKLSLQELVDTLLGARSTRQPSSRRSSDGTAVGRPDRGRGEQPLAARFLTNREKDVLRLLVAAESTRGIAKRLGITVPTTRGYIQSTFTKLGVHSRVEAVTYAVVNSVVEVE